jgi:hypothetical protein
MVRERAGCRRYRWSRSGRLFERRRPTEEHRTRAVCRWIWGDYLILQDWTARQIRTDNRGSMPAHLEPLFERLGISSDLWVECVVNYRKWFRSTVGRPKAMTVAAESHGHNRAISSSSSRRVFY